jgi:hypothetical protein
MAHNPRHLFSGVLLRVLLLDCSIVCSLFPFLRLLGRLCVRMRVRGSARPVSLVRLQASWLASFPTVMQLRYAQFVRKLVGCLVSPLFRNCDIQSFARMIVRNARISTNSLTSDVVFGGLPREHVVWLFVGTSKQERERERERERETERE